MLIGMNLIKSLKMQGMILSTGVNPLSVLDASSGGGL